MGKYVSAVVLMLPLRHDGQHGPISEFQDRSDCGPPAPSPRPSALRSVLGLVVVLQEKILYYVLPAFFTAYLVYGFVRPASRRRLADEEIEDEDEDDQARPLTRHAGPATHPDSPV